MESKISTAIQVSGAAVLALLLADCRGGGGTTSLEERLGKLPTLPPDLAATLDPKTNATRVPVSQPALVRDPSPKPAGCCAIQDLKALKLSIPLTKCAPLRDFIMAPIQGLVMASDTTGGQGGGGAPGGAAGAVGAKSNVRAYRLNAVNHGSLLDTIVCMTSDGPWDATFIEDRACNNYAPQDSLFVNEWGGLAAYYWQGGVANHPQGIQLASCREIGTFRSLCGGLSTCSCDSSPCPADQPCPCSLPW